MPFKYPSMAERLIANSVISITSFFDGSPCWEWIGAYTTNRTGMRYGKLSVRISRGPRKGKVKTWLAHRLALITFKRVTLSIRQRGLHLCNNSICINPAHLLGGTQRKNVRQCVKDGRHRTPWRRVNGERYAAEVAA